jgi:hypothetical protein
MLGFLPVGAAIDVVPIQDMIWHGQSVNRRGSVFMQEGAEFLRLGNGPLPRSRFKVQLSMFKVDETGFFFEL